MRVTKWLAGTIVGAGLTLVVALPASAEQAAAIPPQTSRFLYDAVDPVSGARITVHRAPLGEAHFDVAHPAARVSRRATRTGSVTVMEAGGERVTLRTSAEGVVFEQAGARVEVRADDRTAVQALHSRVAKSVVVDRATEMLSRVRSATSSPAGVALQSTVMMLKTVRGDDDAARHMAVTVSALRELSTRARVILASDEGPRECWDPYARDVQSFWNEMVACLNGEQWWDVVGRLGCNLRYDLQVLGAVTWYVACVNNGTV